MKSIFDELELVLKIMTRPKTTHGENPKTNFESSPEQGPVLPDSAETPKQK